MKVPEPVRIIFDTFPLKELPAIDNEEAQSEVSESILGVYSLDDEGFPMDPRCLEMYGYLLLRNQSPKVAVISPYATSNQTLPSYWPAKTEEKTGTRDRVISSIDEASRMLQDEQAMESKTKIFRSMIDTWIADAWHETIMSPAYAEVRSRIYAESLKHDMPWPFNRSVAKQLAEHSDDRHFTARQATGDDYYCIPENLHRAAMALHALEDVIEAPLSGEPRLLDLMVFSYTWPIIQHLGESSSASLLSPMSRQHAQEVRSYFVNIR